MKKNRFLNFLIVIFCLFLIISLSRSLLELSGAGTRVTQVQKELEISREKNSELKKKLAEAQSQQYLEKIARDNLGLAKAGEMVVILPEQTPFLNLKPKEEIPNWQKWLKMFID